MGAVQEGGVSPISLLAASSFVGDLYKAVVVSAANTVELAANTTDKAIGLIGMEVAAGEICPIIPLVGRLKGKAGAGGVTAGQIVVLEAGGALNSVAVGALADNVLGLGIALQTADADDVFEFFAMPIARSNDAA